MTNRYEYSVTYMVLRQLVFLQTKSSAKFNVANYNTQKIDDKVGIFFLSDTGERGVGDCGSIGIPTGELA